MVETTNSDEVQGLIEFWADSVLSESPEAVNPSTATEVETVVESQLTENTGRHILDSGDAYGRNFEENRETHPSEKPVYNVHGDGADGFVTKNVYHYMTETFERDRQCVALESALYEFGRSDDQERESWLNTMKEFGEWVGLGYFEDFEDFGLGTAISDVLAAIEYQDHISWNTYNSEFGSLSQCIQGVTVNPESSDSRYSLVQIHGGTDIRGGYTGPRVFKHEYTGIIPVPMEAHVSCDGCGWSQAESVLHGHQHGDKEQLVVFDRDNNETRCAKCDSEVMYHI